MQPASCTIQPGSSDDGLPEVLYEFTPEQVEALEELRQKLRQLLTPDELEAIKQRMDREQAAIERMAAAPTLEEQQRIGGELWAEHVERPRAARRIETARRVAPAATRPTRPGRVTVKRRARAARTTTPSRGDPHDDPDEPAEQTWALTFVDRAPVFWRFRAVRCRYVEWREGVGR
jgi:hypothetical protein